MKRNPLIVILAVLYMAASNAWIFVREYPVLGIAAAAVLVLVNIFAGKSRFKLITERRIRIEYHGVRCLLIFLISFIGSVAFQIALFHRFINDEKLPLIISLVWCIVFLAVLFWNGIICVYLSSQQLGIKLRVVGLIFGWIFPVNLVILCIIMDKCFKEVFFEVKKEQLDASRIDQKICRTRYPILFVHGVFFRDSKILNYWGRIPQELKKNGAQVFYGLHQSALSVEDSAAELMARIRGIIAETGCEKVNIIAHSKGGLDCRRAIHDGAESMVASLTTINTPHRGCDFADYLLKMVPQAAQDKIAAEYNKTAEVLGDTSPDFMAAVRDLTAAKCAEFNEQVPQPESIFCQSVGSQLMKAQGGRFPLNFSYRLVKHFDRNNDGLVGEHSFSWGEKHTYLVPDRKRGISHADVIDLNRENIPGFDVREFYVQLVSDLRERGL